MRSMSRGIARKKVSQNWYFYQNELKSVDSKVNFANYLSIFQNITPLSSIHVNVKSAQ